MTGAHVPRQVFEDARRLEEAFGKRLKKQHGKIAAWQEAQLAKREETKAHKVARREPGRPSKPAAAKSPRLSEEEAAAAAVAARRNLRTSASLGLVVVPTDGAAASTAAESFVKLAAGITASRKATQGESDL